MMLRIKRVPTVVSNFQREEVEEDSRHASGCGRNCFRSCCLPGVKLPMYAFKKMNKIEVEKKSAGSENKEPPVPFLGFLLLGEWEDRMQRSLFRYDVTTCETKVSPVEYRHILLIPQILECLPQRIDRDSFLLALYMAAGAKNPYFRLGYNSLGAFATINHPFPGFYLSFLFVCHEVNNWFKLFASQQKLYNYYDDSRQVYYSAVPFPIEMAPTRKITTSRGVKIRDILNYPIRDYSRMGAFKGIHVFKRLGPTSESSSMFWVTPLSSILQEMASKSSSITSWSLSRQGNLSQEPPSIFLGGLLIVLLPFEYHMSDMSTNFPNCWINLSV
ncbi:unnamed protein product [Fraxinus pennsylvanica]|uniref:GDPGP1-like N-terminal domain-containing protein n=1 Tax=Fraxinus pennsylvanica TaxID=56036 RepID=A0AAD2A4P9_9LAMI|nr:unnamed protein product [Fraxinus pennsylvanica]